MLYFDTAYILKCYLNEPGAETVRALLTPGKAIFSSEWMRLEFVCAIKRQVKNKYVAPQRAEAIFKQFEQDITDGLWRLFPLTPMLLDQAVQKAQALPAAWHIPSGDALHLACASLHGFQEIHSNDQHLILAAPHYGLRCINVIPKA